jgi:hypothetical protein
MGIGITTTINQKNYYIYEYEPDYENQQIVHNTSC